MIDGAMKPFHPPKNPFDMWLCSGKPVSTLEFDTSQSKGTCCSNGKHISLCSGVLLVHTWKVGLFFATPQGANNGSRQPYTCIDPQAQWCC